MNDFREELGRRVLVLDGAMGTMIQRLGLSEKDFRGERFASHPCNLQGCIDVLNITRPDAVEAIHKAYLEAGADIIETNTFSSQPVSLAEYSLGGHAAEIAGAGVAVARRAADSFMAVHPGKKVRVAATMGPTSKSLSMSATVKGDKSITWQELEDAFYVQAKAFIENGADVILIETVFDTMNAKAASMAVRRAFDEAGKELPVMVSVTLTRQGRTLSGQTLDAVVASLAHCNPVSVGLNCGFGAEQLAPYIESLRNVPFAISFHPNAGHPDELGVYKESPEKMASDLRGLLRGGRLNIVGGCCGTGPAHIEAIAREAATAVPRPVPAPDGILRLAGLEAVALPSEGAPLTKVGERCNVAGSRKFLRLIKENSLDEALEIARAQIKAGAKVIDVNVDDAMLDAPQEMARFLDCLASDAEIASVPVMIDSSDWTTIQEGLRHLQGKGIVNSISLKEGEDEFVRKARHILRMGAAVVVMAMDEQGQADTFERKMEIVRRSYGILTEKVGFAPESIIFDPNVLAVATGIPAHNDYARAFIEASIHIKKEFPGVHVSGGVSNLSFSFRGNDPVRKAMHAEFISLARGLDMAIVNPSAELAPEKYPSDLREVIIPVLLNESPEAPARLEEKASAILAAMPPKAGAKKIEKKESGAETATAASRLAAMIVKGSVEGMDAALAEEIAAGKSAMEIVDGSLMKGMDEVGARFGEGRMFLPQVVRSADAMKHAVEWLKPFIEKSAGDGGTSSRPKVVIATVKGDVHDIGKNIVAIILRCNGFEVDDLGVMVPADEILRHAREGKADMVCLSGLITPSLHEMTVVAGMLEKEGMKIPLFVGGAATSPLHTAVKIAPGYSAPVFHTFDAARLPVVARAWLNPATRGATEEQNRKEQERLRASLHTEDTLMPYAEALGRAPQRPEAMSAFAASIPAGRVDFSFSISELVPLINWRAFFTAWKLDASLASVADIEGCDHCKAQWIASMPEGARGKAAEAMQLHKEAKRVLQYMQTALSDTSVKARAVMVEAASRGDDIVLRHGDDTVVIPTLRQQTKDGDGCRMAMADFVVPSPDSFPDRVGVFAVTAGDGVVSLINRKKELGDDFTALLYQSLADRLAEAATELMHRRLSAGTGIRPAIGYQSLPDQSLVFEADKLTDYASMGITLTSNGAMNPQASTTGLLIFNPSARYFTVGDISESQARDYAARRGMAYDEILPFIGTKVVGGR